ncbi:MAG TPA: HNH endonuclease [Syntrophorhabdaceae bacterium]|nr:HNH endonuclease [Syntrophorhabdaceae bacterium]
MQEYEFFFLSLNRSFIMTIGTDEQGLVDFLSMFSLSVDAENSIIQIRPFQQTTLELRNNINSFVDKHKANTPQVHSLRQFVEGIGEGEFFFFHPNRNFSTQDIVTIGNYLRAANGNEDFELLTSQTQESLGRVLENYEPVAYANSRRTMIGESERKKRVCRFCGQSEPVVKFRKVAHAISESLGNKSIILNEECDTCNEVLGDEVEIDMINYLSLYRTFFTVHGKDGIPKMKEKTFRFQHLKDREFAFVLQGDNTATEYGPPKAIIAKTNQRVALQNIYKTLCKYALSVIERKYIPYFTETIEWIRGRKDFSELPKIAMLTTYQFMDSVASPAIIVYRRKTNDKNLPYLVGEFHFTCLVFIFVVPLSSQDDRTFTYSTDYDGFWNCFPYSRIQDTNWKFDDFSDSQKRLLEFKIKLLQRK